MQMEQAGMMAVTYIVHVLIPLSIFTNARLGKSGSSLPSSYRFIDIYCHFKKKKIFIVFYRIFFYYYLLALSNLFLYIYCLLQIFTFIIYCHFQIFKNI